jgi:predicted peroxiredoxin
VPKKMVVFCGSDTPEKAFPPFMLGLGALASELELMLFFSMSGLNIIKKGGADQIKLPNAPMTLPEFIDKARDMGARMVACSAAFPIAGVREEELVDGVTVGGVATFVAEAEEADIVLTF